MSSVKLNLREMLDIALPAPDMEVINFHILHKLLKTMIEALQMDDMHVDLSASSLIATNDKSTETERPDDEHSEKALVKCEGDGGGGFGGGAKNNKFYNRNRDQADDRKYIEANEKLATKIHEMDTQIVCLNDYVIQCVRTISKTVGMVKLPRLSVRLAEIAADSILCELMQTVEPVSTEKSICQRLDDLEEDQVEQWDTVTSLGSSFEKYSKHTDALLQDVKTLECKSKQMLENYTRFATITETTIESQTKTNESMDKRLKLVSSMLEKEKKLTNCSLKGVERLLEQKVDRYDLECLKEYVKNKVKEMNVRPNLGIRKIADKCTSNAENPIINQSNAENPTMKDQIMQQFQAYSNTLTVLDNCPPACVCSFVKGQNGAVYRANCICCKEKLMSNT